MATAKQVVQKVIDFTDMSRNAQSLKGKLVRADDAVRCCHRAKSKLNGKLTKVMNQFIGIVSELDALKTETLGFVAGPGFGQLVRLTASETAAVASAVEGGAVVTTGAAAAGALLSGAVIILGAREVAAIAGQTGAIEAASGMARVLGHAISQETEDDCYECIKQKVLSQDKPRRWIRKRIKQRH